jgi:hypothetical protein
MSLLNTQNTAPGDHAVAVSPSNDAPLAATARALYVGTAGHVTLITTGGDTVTFKNVPAGGYVTGVLIAYVKLTGTTAADIVAFSCQ